MNKIVLLTIGLLFLVACGGGGTAASSTTAAAPTDPPVIETDPETGLAVNPIPVPADGEFIVRGEISAATLIPQDRPYFTVKIPGASYSFTAQPVREIFLDDGTQLAPHLIGPGLTVHATLKWGEEVGPGGTPGFFTEDMVILAGE
jgi:hypothetical protein